MRGLQKKSGVILPIVLVVVVMLTLMAVSLARRTQVDLALMKNTAGKTASRYLAWAGIVYAIDEIRADSRDKVSVLFDRIGLCGFSADENVLPRERFRAVNLGGGTVDIGYDIGGQRVDGFSDEDSKINLNGLNPENIRVFIELLMMSGLDDEDAAVMAYAALDWKDADDDPAHPEYGAEDEFYAELKDRPYHAKNFFFESVDELFLLRGARPDVIGKISPHVTLFPQSDFLRVNIDTAPDIVLKAVGRSFAGGQTGADMEDADSLAGKIVDYRSGDDGRPGTEDDRLVDFGEMQLNQKEAVIAEKIKAVRTSVSDHVRVSLEAVDGRYGVKTAVEAVIDRNDLSIVAWKRQ